jgi:hypothetical protein
MKERIPGEISAPGAFLESVVPIVVIGSFYPSPVDLVGGSYSAGARDCTVTVPSVGRCIQNERYSAPAKIAPTNWAAT